MVNYLSSLVFIVLFLVLPSTGEAKPEIVLILDKTELQIGHHINASLYGISLNDKLVNVDLSDLEEAFGIKIIETTEDIEDDRWPGKQVQLLKFKLFPRKTGNHIISNISFEGSKVRQKNISVQQGFNKLQNGQVKISRNTQVTPASPWEREQVLVEVEVITTDHYASLHYETLNIPGFDVFNTQEKRRRIETNGIEYTAIKVAWALFPLIPGKRYIDIPSIEYYTSGKKTRSYYFPKQELNVTPLPVYIPPTMPVGKVSISSQLETNSLLYPDTLYYWDIRLAGYKVSPNWMTTIIPRTKENGDVYFFQRTSTQETLFEKDSLNTIASHTIPFKPLSNGNLSLPNIHVQYFDPDSGKIVTASHKPGSILALSFSWRATILLLGVCLLFLASIYCYQKLSIYIERRQHYKSAKTQIKNATSFVELRNALQSISIAEDWPVNMTTKKWALTWKTKSAEDDVIEALTEKLNQSCYGKKSSSDLAKLKAEFLDVT